MDMAMRCIGWVVIVALVVLIIIQQHTINDYKLIVQTYELAVQEYERNIVELAEEIK